MACGLIEFKSSVQRIWFKIPEGTHVNHSLAQTEVIPFIKDLLKSKDLDTLYFARMILSVVEKVEKTGGAILWTIDSKNLCAEVHHGDIQGAAKFLELVKEEMPL